MKRPAGSGFIFSSDILHIHFKASSYHTIPPPTPHLAMLPFVNVFDHDVSLGFCIKKVEENKIARC